MAIKITDLVDRGEIDKLNELDSTLKKTLDTYTRVARDLAKGLEINVSTIGDIDRLENLLATKGREAAQTQQQLTQVIGEQQKVIANTTNTISRQLMEQERLNKTQREAYTDTDAFRRLLEQVNGSYENRIKRLIETNQAIEANKKHQENLKKVVDSGRISYDEYTRRLVELTKIERELKQTKSDLTTQLKNEEREMQSVEGSYRNLSQRLELMKKAYKDLTDEERESPLGKEMEGAIQNLNAHLIDMAADMGEFQRNVGNYAIATSGLKKQYDDLVGTLATLQSRYDALSEAEKSGQAGQELAGTIEKVKESALNAKAALEENTQAVENARRSLGDMGGATSSIKKDLKELVLEIANLSIEYQHLSEEEKNSAAGQELASHIQELTEQAGVLKDAISDTNAAIANAASDTRTFDQLGGAIQLAIDGFGLAQGAAAMLGISEGELAEIQTKLQAAIAASNAMQSIQNALQKQSALMQAASLIQTKLRTAAENIHTAAQGKGVIATKAATVAQWAFNAAANANPIGLIVAGIVLAAGAVWGLVKAFNAFTSPSEEALKNYREQKQALENLCQANDQVIERMKARGATQTDLNAQALQHTIAEKDAAEAIFARAGELYKKDSDEYKEALETKNSAREEYETALTNSENYLHGIIAKAEQDKRKAALGTYEYKRRMIQAELEKQKEIAGLLLKQAKITEAQYNGLVMQLEAAAKFDLSAVDKDEASKAAESAKKRAEELKKAVQAGEDALLKIISDSLEQQRQAEILSYNRQLAELKSRLAKTATTEKDMRKALNNQIEGLTAEHNRRMENLQLSMSERTNNAEGELIASHLSIIQAGTEEELQWRYKELSNQQHRELLALQKSEAAKTITAEQAEEERTNIAIKYAQKREELEANHAAKVAETTMQKYADERDVQDNAYVLAEAALKQRYAKELAAAKGNAQQQEAVTRKYETERTKLAEDYAKQTAQSSIDMLEEVLKAENLSDKDRLKYEKELAKAKGALETAMADAAIAQIKRTNEEDERATEKRRANAQQWLQVASDSLNAINDLVGAVYDAKIQKVEEEQEVNTAAGEAEVERITQLVEQQVITEEEGEARKRAAEDATARKNEELEKKKQELKQKQATWDKANSIAQVGINTAVAIMQTGAQIGYPAAIPFVAMIGALGALQLATILATPIPKYAKGTDSHKGGPAIVGDGGVPELVIFGGKSWITPDTPTVVDLPTGAIVKPKIDGIDDIAVGMIPLLSDRHNQQPPVIINNDYKRLEDKMDTFISVMRRHSNRQHNISMTSLNNHFSSLRV